VGCGTIGADGQVRMIVLEEGGAVGVAEAKNGDERPDGKVCARQVDLA